MNILFNSDTKTIRVTLTYEQLEWAKAIGRRRYASQRQANRPDWKARQDADGLKYDIDGAKGEVALLLAMGFSTDSYQSFTPINKWLKTRANMTDVADIEVRTTVHQRGRLILKHDKDAFKQDNPFVLTRIVGDRDIRLVGWMFGREGMDPKYLDPDVPRPNYFVPADDLHGMDELFKRYSVTLPPDEDTEYLRLLNTEDKDVINTESLL